MSLPTIINWCFGEITKREGFLSGFKHLQPSSVTEDTKTAGGGGGSPTSLVVFAAFGKVPGSKLNKLQVYGRHISNA